MRPRLLLLLLFGTTVLAKEPPSAETVAQWIADAYGHNTFHQVTELRYTFHVQLPDRQVSRQWIWRPQDHQVTLVGNSGTTTYNRTKLADDQALRDVDAKFINDQYWLLMPFHLVWDPGIRLELSAEPEPLPLGDGKGRRLTVQYPDGVGYTPGDAYDLYYDQDFTLTHWVYRKGGAAEPTRASTWEDHQRFGPLLISQMHRGSGGFRVWFTDVTVKTEE